MKERIIAALKTAYAKLGLSDEAFDGVAALLEKTVTEESEIATAVSGDNVKTLLTTIQGQVDSWKNKFYDKDKELKTYKEKHPETNPTPKDPPKDDEPEYIKKLREQNEQILARFKADDDAKKYAASLAKVEAGLKEKGCTNPGILKGVLKGFALKDNETEEQAITRLTEEYNQSVKDTFGDGPVPRFGGMQNKQDPKDAVQKKNDYLIQEGLLPKPE